MPFDIVNLVSTPAILYKLSSQTSLCCSEGDLRLELADGKRIPPAACKAKKQADCGGLRMRCSEEGGRSKGDG